MTTRRRTTLEIDETLSLVVGFVPTKGDASVGLKPGVEDVWIDEIVVQIPDLVKSQQLGIRCWKEVIHPNDESPAFQWLFEAYQQRIMDAIECAEPAESPEEMGA